MGSWHRLRGRAVRVAAACNRWRCWVVAAAFAAVVLLSAFHVQPQLSDMPASLSGSDAAASVKSHITIEQAVAQAKAAAGTTGKPDSAPLGMPLDPKIRQSLEGLPPRQRREAVLKSIDFDGFKGVHFEETLDTDSTPMVDPHCG